MTSRLDILLQNWPPCVAGTQHWLNSRGIDNRLADKYVRSGRLARIGHGAYAQAGSTVDWPGAVQALQVQLALDVHPGGVTACDLRSRIPGMDREGQEVVLFAREGTRLPSWFMNRVWSRPVRLVATNMLADGKFTLSPVRIGDVELAVASLEQAVFEMMYLVPGRQSFDEALRIMRSLTALRPPVVQRLLETCRSVKTKRLVMVAAERSGHSWVGHLDLSRVSFGSGKRTIHPGGRLDSRYHLVLEESGRQS
ncbi:MAG: hypothetical protein F4Z15_01910 [Gammaproteobacteria bacterium]|nr:hypothetical protein [Gammaproteobacteria bacterium]MYD76228.1 hypothetical protein [Gammaproteobacteria bacterium]